MENKLKIIQDELLNEKYPAEKFEELFPQIVILRKQAKSDFVESMSYLVFLKNLAIKMLKTEAFNSKTNIIPQKTFENIINEIAGLNKGMCEVSKRACIDKQLEYLDDIKDVLCLWVTPQREQRIQKILDLMEHLKQEKNNELCY